MKRSTKITSIIIIFFLIIAGVIVARIMIGMHFQKKFGKRQPPGIIVTTVSQKKFKIVDARNKNRFLGLEKEPRPGIRSGSIKNSYSLPFGQLINPENKTFLKKNKIKEKFSEIGINNENNVVFSCGSGITAAVLGLAYSMINDKYLPTIYDGSWTEYGRIK